MKDLWIIGAGGHAKVVISAALSSGEYRVVGCLDDSFGEQNRVVEGVSVVGDISRESIARFSVEHAVIAIGSNVVRRAIAECLDGAVQWQSIVHRTAWIAPSATLGEGSVVMAHAVVQSGAMISNHVILNTASTVDHDCTLEDYVHLGPGANLAGSIALRQGVFVGIGASVVPGIEVGEWSVVGAGAVVTRSLSANITAVGAPAKVIKERDPGWQN